MDYAAEALKRHREWKGKIQIQVNCPVETRDDLSVAYTPGVAEPCKEISKDVDKSYEYTRRGNLVAVVTDGTAVLGLGDIGPEAGMPVMEGKAVLFKTFGGVDAIPLCIRSKDTDEIVRTVELLAGSFGGINLEDIAAPRCFEIERRLKASLDIPVFHDDQHGTAVVVGAAMINALKVVKKDIAKVCGVVNGAGSAGIACAKLLLSLGVKNLILCDRKGAVCEGEDWLNPGQADMAKITNREHVRGTLADVMKGADFFLGVSAPNCVSAEMVKSMAPRPVVFAMANPVPEIFPEEALAAGAAVVGTGRSDYPNQINNVLAFPGLFRGLLDAKVKEITTEVLRVAAVAIADVIEEEELSPSYIIPGVFRGALDVRAKDINDEMKLAAAFAIAGMIPAEELSPEYIIPSPLDKSVAPEVAKAVAEAARRTNVARI